MNLKETEELRRERILREEAQVLYIKAKVKIDRLRSEANKETARPCKEIRNLADRVALLERALLNERLEVGCKSGWTPFAHTPLPDAKDPTKTGRWYVARTLDGDLFRYTLFLVFYENGLRFEADDFKRIYEFKEFLHWKIIRLIGNVESP